MIYETTIILPNIGVSLIFDDEPIKFYNGLAKWKWTRVYGPPCSTFPKELIDRALKHPILECEDYKYLDKNLE